MTESDPTVELICWSGPASALAAVLQLDRRGKDRLRMLSRRPGKSGAMQIDVCITGQAVMSAVRRKLAGATDSGDDRPAHPLHLPGDV